MERLEQELLLSHVLQVPRSYLYAHPERALTVVEQEQYDALIARRQQGEPIPYILGFKEFWSLNLKVTPETLIPRPETELLVEWALKYLPQGANVADLGTGTGAIALALATERPDVTCYATDISEGALKIAAENAMRLTIHNVIFSLGDWCQALPYGVTYDVIVSNPPYLSSSDPPLPFEPERALLSPPDGLTAIAGILEQAKCYLKSNGYLLIEHGAEQGDAVRSLFKKVGYNNVLTQRDFSGWERVTIGKWMG